METEYGIVRVYLWIKVSDEGRNMRRRTVFQKHSTLDAAAKAVADFLALNPALEKMEREAVFIPASIHL